MDTGLAKPVSAFTQPVTSQAQYALRTEAIAETELPTGSVVTQVADSDESARSRQEEERRAAPPLKRENFFDQETDSLIFQATGPEIGEVVRQTSGRSAPAPPSGPGRTDCRQLLDDRPRDGKRQPVERGPHLSDARRRGDPPPRLVIAYFFKNLPHPSPFNPPPSILRHLPKAAPRTNVASRYEAGVPGCVLPGNAGGGAQRPDCGRDILHP